MDKLAEKPPYIRFDNIAVEDRDATIRNGCYTAKDVEHVFITPAGSKDELVYVAAEWMERQKAAVQSKRLLPDWFKYYQAVYDAWKSGQEPPTTGTPLTAWPGISPAQHENLKRANLRSIEDVACMNEEAIRTVGMGARALQQRAMAYLEVLKSGIGQAAEKSAALEQQNAVLQSEVNDLRQLVNGMKAAMEAQAKAGVPSQPPAQLPGRIEAEDILS